MKSKRGLLVLYSGPSGCGKGTVMQQVLAQRQDTVVSVSVTTRSPRPGEQDGVEYFFRTREQFEQMIEQGQLLEYAQYNGNYYGTPRAEIEKLLEQGKNVILEIEVQGAEKVMDSGIDVVSVFLAPPSMQELSRRLHKRATEEEAVVQSRLDIARREMSRMFRYQFVVVNGELERAVQDVHAILDAERLRYSRIKSILTEDEASC